MKRLKLLVVLISIFSVSVYFRVPYIEKEVSPYNETSSTVLAFLENWKSQGITQHYFAPTLTWQNEGDKFISNYKRLEDKKGNNYYVSYPPFAFLFPYAIISALRIEPGQVFIQILNIILHFISAFFIYLIVCKLYKCRVSEICLPALIGFISYTFIPVLLFIHTFDFFSEMMGQVFFITGIYLFQCLEENKANTSRKLLFLFGLNIFILIYTEWIGVFFVFTLLLIAFLRRKKEIFYRKLSVTLLFSSLLAILLILFQYSCINGFTALFKSLSLRFLERSGIFGMQYSDQGISYENLDSYILLLKHLHQTLLGFGYLAILMIAGWFIKNKVSLKHLLTEKTVVVVMVLPIILEFLLFFNASVIHYICWAKFGIPISIGLAVVAANIFKTKLSGRINMWSIGFTGIVLLFVAISLFAFKTQAEYINQKDIQLKSISSVIKMYSGNDEAVFLSMSENLKQYNTYICFMSKRNIMNVKDTEDADKILKEKQKIKGVFYTFEPRSNQYTIKHIDLNQVAE